MRLAPAVIVHGIRDARAALAPGLPATLLSAPAAGVYAGCAWWQALVGMARAEHPAAEVTDILDCGESAVMALAALRMGQQLLVVADTAPGWQSVAAIMAERGGTLLKEPPPALDLAERGATRRLENWLRLRTAQGDSVPGLG